LKKRRKSAVLGQVTPRVQHHGAVLDPEAVGEMLRAVDAYLAELNELTGPDGFVFPAFHTSLRPLSENTINQAFRRMGYAV
jgi:hypothetical protein